MAEGRSKNEWGKTANVKALLHMSLDLMNNVHLGYSEFTIVFII